MSETKKIRSEAIQYCTGKGIDIGCGGDKITPETWGFDLPQPYTKVGEDLIELRGDCRELPFNDEVLDYVYSSHVLEDFEDTKSILDEWRRVIKIGGHLILYLPVERVYRQHCIAVGEEPNAAHKNYEMDIEQIKSLLNGMKIIKEIPLHAIYSFLIVAQK